MSKLWLGESEYFRAKTVSGQDILNVSKTIPSKIIVATQIHVNVLIWLKTPEYKT